uniref:Uncharacterized protein n=1 Tax=Ciona savignyi TaxID=51511 RepID=H2YMF8_CIOSA
MQNNFKLKYPSENYMSLLHHIYCRFTLECNKNPTLIDFTALGQNVLSSSAFLHFVDQVHNAVDCGSVTTVETVLSFAVKLFVKILSFAFTKKLFQKLSMHSKQQHCSLRKHLKKL